MKVKTLIGLLLEQNPNNEVIYWEKHEGDNFEINQVSDDGVNGEETILNS